MGTRVIRIHDGGFVYYGVREEHVATAGEQPPEGDRVEVCEDSGPAGLANLIEVASFLQHYRSPVAQSEAALRLLGVRCLRDGASPEEVQALAHVDDATLESWCEEATAEAATDR